MSIDGDDDHHSTTEHDEEEDDDRLPFALIPKSPRTPLHPSALKSAAVSPGSSPEYGRELSSHLSPGAYCPALASSVISTPTTTTEEESQSFVSEYDPSSLLLASSQVGSLYLNAAASLLQPNSGLLGNDSSFQLQPRNTTDSSTTDSSTTERFQRPVSVEQSSAGFSQLMQEADNTHDVVLATAGGHGVTATAPAVGRLAALPEEQSVLSNSSGLILGSYHHVPDASSRAPMFGARRAPHEQYPVRAGPAANLGCSSSSSYNNNSYLTQERRLASLAGVTAVTVGPNAFFCRVDLCASNSANITVQTVMDILGNPDLLHLWCDPVPATLVVTESSEGAHNSVNRGTFTINTDRSNDREYEGEWMEATTAALHAPGAGYVHRAGETAASLLGFPATGKVTMFVERQRGRVGLTIGPFAGGMEVHHTLCILQEGGSIRIQDTVKLRRPAEQEESPFCGLFGVLEKCYLPTVDDYLDQVLSSMARLRFLVEKGQDSIYGEATTGDTTCTPLLGVS